jgi:hypothetical protein
MFVKAKNEAKRKFVKQNEAKNLKRKEAKKLVLDFRLNKRKQSETDPVSLRSEKNFKQNRRTLSPMQHKREVARAESQLCVKQQSVQ